jgi:hypothetical protein
MADTTAVAKTEEELEAEVMALMAGGKKKKKGDKKEKKKDKGEKKDKKKDKGEKKDKKKKKKGSDGEGSDSPDSPAAADGEPAAAVAAGEGDDDDEPAAGDGGAEAAGEGKDSGVFSDAAKETYQYQLLLTRMYEILKRNNPEYAVKKRYVMAPPQVYRVGSTRTCWANFATICGQMNRAPDHVLSFFLVRRLCCALIWPVVHAGLVQPGVCAFATFLLTTTGVMMRALVASALSVVCCRRVGRRWTCPICPPTHPALCDAPPRFASLACV